MNFDASRSLPRGLLPAVLTLVLAPLAPAESAAEIRLFSGIDLAVKPPATGTTTPIIAIEGNRFVLDDAAHTRIYPSDAGSFSALNAVKLSRAPVTIDGLHVARTYTPEKDPVMQGMIMQNEMAAQAQIKQAIAERAFMEGEAKRNMNYQYAKANSDAMARGERAPYDGMGTIESANAASSSALEDIAQTYDELAHAAKNTTATDVGTRAGEKGEYDALDLVFSLSSTTPIRDAYVVAIAHVEEDGQKRLRTFYEQVGDLDAKPRRVYLRRTGFRPGFEVKQVMVHLYARGQEMVTNLSPKNTALSPDQTREFLLLTYLGQHATESLPAQPVWSLAPAPLLAADSAAPFDRPVAINVDADGRLISIHDSLTDARAFRASIQDAKTLRTRDAAAAGPTTFAASLRISDDSIQTNQSQHVPPQIVAALRDMFFLPALDVGQPVVSSTEINLASFFP